MWMCRKLRNREKIGMISFLVFVYLILGIAIPEYVLGSEVWPQKATAPFYCLDGGKSWRASDQYKIYQYDTMPSALTEMQAKRLFWAYPTNWNALKEAAKKYDPELYLEIAEISSGPNVVKYVKDDSSSMFAWVADNPEIEQRAITVLEKEAEENLLNIKEAPIEIRDARSKETAMSVTVPAFGSGELSTEVFLGEDFVRDISNIEPQAVWNNGLNGEEAGWQDISEGTQPSLGVMGNQLYEVTWMDGVIRIQNNVTASIYERDAGNMNAEHENKKNMAVLYKITMRDQSEWKSNVEWNKEYLREWMEFKACSNAPGHQRLYKANMKMIPSDMSFYMILCQESFDEKDIYPEIEREDAELSFQIYRHKELFEANYHVKLKKIDDETEKPLKGSQFYLYERFENPDQLGGTEKHGRLAEDCLNFQLWDGYQIFAEGITNEDGEIEHTDVRTYRYEKTYCDGHGMPKWANMEWIESTRETVLGTELEKEAVKNEIRDQNMAAAMQWMQLYLACEEKENSSNGKHFHWLVDDEIYQEVEQVMNSGEPEWEDGPGSQSAKESFIKSGCKTDCEKTYENFIHLQFAYTWKEANARDGYVLHGIHQDDIPIEVIVTNASEAGAESVKLKESSDEIKTHIWYGEQTDMKVTKETSARLKKRDVHVLMASDSNAVKRQEKESKIVEDENWEENSAESSFESYYEAAIHDRIKHIDVESKKIFSYPTELESGRDYWLIRNHRSEGEIYFNKKDMELWERESDTYSAYGDTEGDGQLGGAVYGLFAADDIVHPDSEMLSAEEFSNTGIVYKKNDLVAITETNVFGDAVFSCYTEKPGMQYDYEEQRINQRIDISWDGPQNRYEENLEAHGNYWIGRPLILGNYYIKELSRSEGYELSVNGKSGNLTNYGKGFETPAEISDENGYAKISIMDTVTSMEGDDLTGNGYDQISFRVTSFNTSGYEIKVGGLPEGIEFYRVDYGETEVTAPRIIGTEEVILYDDSGEILWKTAENNNQYLKYIPEHGGNGDIIGQKPACRSEWQSLKDEQVPEIILMEINDMEPEIDDPRWDKPLNELTLKEEGEDYRFLKAEFEKLLRRNHYRTPETFDGRYSQNDRPVYSMGVKKGQDDIYEMTTNRGEPALKTVYGAAVFEICISDLDENATLYDLWNRLAVWYMEHPQWSFGGIHSLKELENGYEVIVYAGTSINRSRSFFTIDPECDSRTVEKVYTVVENPFTLRWEYQEYEENGEYRFDIERQYFFGNEKEKRYYIDVLLTPAVRVNAEKNRVPLEHTVMEYHKQGEEIIDYLAGDPEFGYRVYRTKEVEKIEVTSELEYTEIDVPLENVVYDKENKQYLISVEMGQENSFGEQISDEENVLELIFMAKLPKSTVLISESDIERFNHTDTSIKQYQIGDIIGYGEYLMKTGNITSEISNEQQEGMEDTYMIGKSLVYRSQYQVLEDGDTKKKPVQVLERPIKQKVKVIKKTEQGEAVGDFQFKIYLKSNLENLCCDENGSIVWLDIFGNTIDITEYKSNYPEMVQKIITRKTDRRILETQENEEIIQNNYKKFFDAIYTANTDKWENKEGIVKNTSSKPIAKSVVSGKKNKINTSEEAEENAKRSDAVRQFAINWYMEDSIKNLTQKATASNGIQIKQEMVVYSDELYDKALYKAIQKAEVYLQPFFNYDLDSVYEIHWDSALAGDEDQDYSTLSAGQVWMTGASTGNAYGISEYLPYGEYVIVEQQPLKEDGDDLENCYYQTDAPKELSLPQYDHEKEVYMEHTDIPWTVTEPGIKEEMSGYAEKEFLNRKYKVIVRIEKNDFETGEPILHDNAIFAFYKAEMNPEKPGKIRRYEQETMITGSRMFLEAMGAKQVTQSARNAGDTYWGFVQAGTPVCREEDGILFTNGKQRDEFYHISTMLDQEEQGILQNVGYVETPQSLDAGVYVLAELKAPEGYIRSKPIAVEIFSDGIQYGIGEDEERAALVYGLGSYKENEIVARLYVSNLATSLEVEKTKSSDLYHNMKISGRVEGNKSALDMMYGLENLELAYNSAGTYLGFGWRKGTLEYLEYRKREGENLELVYENGVFQGYGYIRKRLETSEYQNKYVPGATLALFEAIEVKMSGDSEDYAFCGVEVNRDTGGAVTSIKVKKDFAGKTEDTEVLFYDLHNLQVLETASDGTQYGFDRNGHKMKLMYDTKSIFAIRNGKAEFELTGGMLQNVKYDKNAGLFLNVDKDTKIYHLNNELCRDGLVDSYTGLAYIEKEGFTGERGKSVFVWPIRTIKNHLGTVAAKEKCLTGRPGEIHAGTEFAYMTGTLEEDEQILKKEMNPIYNSYGMVSFYPKSEDIYKIEETIYDRDGAFIGYRQEDLLEQYNQACFGVHDPTELYGSDRNNQVPLNLILRHRIGEAWIIPNIWITGAVYPQDPSSEEMTDGQKDLLRRIKPGNYIMEEIKVPEGYVRSMPVAVTVTDLKEPRRVSMVNERIKVEIAKIDGTDQYKKEVHSDKGIEFEWCIESKSSYTNEPIIGSKLALYRAERVYTSDYSRYPKGYYLVKKEDTPASWYVEDPEDSSKKRIEALWWTDGQVKYFEGIPAGDYLLEELETPKGYLPASMELTVLPIEELQSFILRDDHTKVEIFKYEEDDSGNKIPLTKPKEAEFTLYSAVTDSLGNPVKRDGEFFHSNIPVVQWRTGPSETYKEELCREYENMYQLFGPTFSEFTWKWKDEQKNQESSAMLENNYSTNGGETVIQEWRLEDQSVLRVMIGKNAGFGQTDAFGKITPTFEYQFDYRENEEIPDMVTYESMNGIRRLDRIPEGVYILVETEAPVGYEKAEPIAVVVQETDAVQRFYMKNQKIEDARTGKLVIVKVDAEHQETGLVGARFEVKNLQSGEIYLAETDENGQASLEQLPIRGLYENGAVGPCIYQVKEIHAPNGYCINQATWYIRFEENENGECVQKLIVCDEKTKIQIQKSDFLGGYFVSGAILSIYETKMQNGTYVTVGDPLEQWTSNGDTHVVTGKLSCGKTYILVEESAPEGYTVSSPIRFTVSENGRNLIYISNHLAQVEIHYREDVYGIESIQISGQGLKKTEYTLYNNEGQKVQVTGSGKPIFWKQICDENNNAIKIKEGEILTIEESVELWDENQICLEREHMRVEKDSARELVSGGRYPITMEYVWRDCNGSRLDTWCVDAGMNNHEIINSRKEDGEYLLKIGETYFLEQFVILNDGYRQKVQTMSVCLGQNGVADLEIFDQKTYLEIRKTDITTGAEMIGAVLVVKDVNGTILDQWISSEKAHVIEGTLIPEETYILSEIQSADGYAYAKEIPFILQRNGMIEKITMEDRPTKVQIQKIDHDTGEILAGALLCIKDSDGNVVSQWMSGKSVHMITGKLIAGETYTLEECNAPKGYCLAEPITFTVSLDGDIDSLIMENLQMQGKNEETENVPKKDHDHTYGTITAKYQIRIDGDGILRIRIPENASLTLIPRTSDESFPWWSVWGLSIAVGGIIILRLIRRDADENDG